MQSAVFEGVIRNGELYTLRQARARLGLTDSALRSLRRAGMPVIRFGKRAYVSGGEVIRFFEGLKDHAEQSESCEPRAEIPGLALARS